MTPDLVNGLFEFAGSLFTWMNVVRVHKDRGYAGIYLPAIVFFTLWGGWNLFYYPFLEQWWSFAGGISIMTANVAWIALMLIHGRKQ